MMLFVCLNCIVLISITGSAKIVYKKSSSDNKLSKSMRFKSVLGSGAASTTVNSFKNSVTSDDIKDFFSKLSPFINDSNLFIDGSNSQVISYMLKSNFQPDPLITSTINSNDPKNSLVADDMKSKKPISEAINEKFGPKIEFNASIAIRTNSTFNKSDDKPKITEILDNIKKEEYLPNSTVQLNSTSQVLNNITELAGLITQIANDTERKIGEKIEIKMMPENAPVELVTEPVELKPISKVKTEIDIDNSKFAQVHSKISEKAVELSNSRKVITSDSGDKTFIKFPEDQSIKYIMPLLKNVPTIIKETTRFQQFSNQKNDIEIIGSESSTEPPIQRKSQKDYRKLKRVLLERLIKERKLSKTFSSSSVESRNEMIPPPMFTSKDCNCEVDPNSKIIPNGGCCDKIKASKQSQVILNHITKDAYDDRLKQYKIQSSSNEIEDSNKKIIKSQSVNRMKLEPNFTHYGYVGKQTFFNSISG